jgi:hypothetical protein
MHGSYLKDNKAELLERRSGGLPPRGAFPGCFLTIERIVDQLQ